MKIPFYPTQPIARRCLLSGLAVLTLGMATPTVHAQPQLPPSSTSMRRLNLTEEQMHQVQEMRQQTMERFQKLQNELRQVRRRLEVLYRDYELDMVRARQLNEQINRIQKDILDTHLQVEKRLREILKPDQFAKLRADMQRRPSKKPGGK